MRFCFSPIRDSAAAIRRTRAAAAALTRGYCVVLQVLVVDSPQHLHSPTVDPRTSPGEFPQECGELGQPPLFRATLLVPILPLARAVSQNLFCKHTRKKHLQM